MKIQYIIIIVCLTIVFGAGSFIACKTFKPIWIDQLPSECNMTLNSIKLYYGSKDKSGAVQSIILCNKKLHRLSCREQHYGAFENGEPKPVDYENFDKYKAYNSCMNELR